MKDDITQGDKCIDLKVSRFPDDPVREERHYGNDEEAAETGRIGQTGRPTVDSSVHVLVVKQILDQWYVALVRQMCCQL